MTRQQRYYRKHREYYKAWRRNNVELQESMRRDWLNRNRKRVNSVARSLRKSNKRFILELKYRPCADCGVQYPSFIMHFDHVDPASKKRSLSKMSGCSERQIIEEAVKCDVVCANCHGLRTYKKLLTGEIRAFGRRYVS